MEHGVLVTEDLIPVPRLSDRAARQRSPEQRLNLRFPELSRRQIAAFGRLPPGFPGRRRTLGRAVALVYAAANRRDFEVVLLGLDPVDYEYRPAPGLTPPDLDPVFRGHDGYLRLWRYWLEAFEDIQWEPGEIIDFGERFVVTAQQRGSGSGSGVAVSEPVFQVFTLRDGLVLRQEDFLDRDAAVTAASRTSGPRRARR